MGFAGRGSARADSFSYLSVAYPVGRVERSILDGYFFAPKIASLAALATRNFTTRLAGILIVAPVAGLRPMRALRFTSTSLPRPGIVKEFLAFL